MPILPSCKDKYKASLRKVRCLPACESRIHVLHASRKQQSFKYSYDINMYELNLHGPYCTTLVHWYALTQNFLQKNYNYVHAIVQRCFIFISAYKKMKCQNINFFVPNALLNSTTIEFNYIAHCMFQFFKTSELIEHALHDFCIIAYLIATSRYCSKPTPFPSTSHLLICFVIPTV